MDPERIILFYYSLYIYVTVRSVSNFTLFFPACKWQLFKNPIQSALLVSVPVEDPCKREPPTGSRFIDLQWGLVPVVSVTETEVSEGLAECVTRTRLPVHRAIQNHARLLMPCAKAELCQIVVLIM